MDVFALEFYAFPTNEKMTISSRGIADFIASLAREINRSQIHVCCTWVDWLEMRYQNDMLCATLISKINIPKHMIGQNVHKISYSKPSQAARVSWIRPPKRNPASKISRPLGGVQTWLPKVIAEEREENAPMQAK